MSKFIPARQEIVDQYGGLTNDAVGAWIEDGNLPRAYVEVDELEKLEQEAAFKHRHGKQLMREFPDEFQTACECLEYGEGFGSWFSRVEDPDLTKEKAKILWKMAVAKVANED